MFQSLSLNWKEDQGAERINASVPELIYLVNKYICRVDFSSVRQTLSLISSPHLFLLYSWEH